MIQCEARLNVPEEVRDGVEAVLANALNVRNRPTKLLKFAFETSEDALTWTAFRYLFDRGEIGSSIAVEGLSPRQVWFWGSRWPQVNTDLLRSELTTVLRMELGEQASSLSEPDFIAEDDSRLVFVEVKYGARNDCKPRYKGFPQYLKGRDDLFVHTSDQVATAGYYELVRNWVAGSTLAERRGKKFVLVNLAGEACRPTANAFAQSLQLTGQRGFRFVAWNELVNRLNQPLEPWFARYLRIRFAK
jgi:hypothetical protein